MLQPKRTKYRKSFRGRRKGAASTGSTINFGEYGLKAMGTDWITARQIEAARVAVTRHLRRGGQVWVRVFPDKSVSKKPAEVRMGGGKAAVDHWVAVVRPGRILFEVAGVPPQDAVDALELASHKLPIPTKTVHRNRMAALAGGAG
ncbi:MAG: 50S ribosomal protein L16 [Dehalococcoidia bacterium]|jgi:large subunit ribosomal protein L16|nr:50S ribosomal protein L16 [Dehalococcoidia bacterium]MDP6227891.1 50S ribosomal protein L16 [Dehalococcoidia bacterium]MDP7082849.1 50S ribosomal protein L16 [Dehalococcoidia bacterium]MDP7200157.1 50S ribosomal protein L16 [Dehalococcoidia bacterium]MDP7509691.1 50S ribosomal protein L16 [Dehalococcoidia bacterium]